MELKRYTPIGTNKVSPHFKVEWSGYLSPPLSDRFNFTTVLGASEQIAIWIDGKIIYAAGFAPEKNVSHSVQLTKGHRHRIRIEYVNPKGRAELNLMWSSRILDPARLPITALYSSAK